MSWLVFIYISTTFWLSEAPPPLKCLAICNYTLNTSSVFYEPNKCKSKTETRETKVCSVKLQFNYKKSNVSIFRDSAEKLPPNFDNKFQRLSTLTTRIDLKNGDVYHDFTHYCSMNASCTTAFMKDTFDKYKTLSYKIFVENLRHLLRLSGPLSKELVPINCFVQNGDPMECMNGICTVFKSPYSDTMKAGCGLSQNNVPAPFIIDTPNLNISTQFSINFQCYWSLCNDESLVYTTYYFIRDSLHSPMGLTTFAPITYMNTSRKLTTVGHTIHMTTSTKMATVGHTTYTYSSAKVTTKRITKVTTASSTISTDIKSDSSHYQMTFLSIVTLCLTVSLTLLVYSS